MSGFISSGKDDAAVEELLSQAKDLYVLEQVTALNCASFTDNDSALPAHLETRLRRLKSLPVSRTDPPVSSSSKKLLSHSKSMAIYTDKKNRGNVSSASAFSIQTGKSCPLDSSVEDTQIFSETKRNPNVNSRGELGELSRIGSSSSRFSQQGNKVLTPTTQTMKLLVPKEKSRISSSSIITSTDLASTSSSKQEEKERMKRKSKSKSKFLTSWFDKLSLAQGMGCLSGKSSSSNSKRTKESIEESSFEEKLKRLEKESKRREVMLSKLVKMLKDVS